MISERTIINALILGAGLIVGPFLTISTFHGDYWPLLVAGGVVAIMAIFLILGHRMAALPLLGMAYTGKINFLPLGLSASDISLALVIVYYLVCYVALRQRSIRMGYPGLTIPIVLLLLLIFYHEHALGVKALGSTTMGGRGGVMAMVSLATYLCAINLPNPSVTFLQRLPWYWVGLVFLSAVPYIATTYFPSTAPYFYYISDNVNISAYEGVAGEREASQAFLGSTLQGVLLAYYPLRSWWRPERWWVVFASVICAILVMHGGYRSTMSLYLLTFVLGAWCYSTWKSLVVLPAFAVVAFCLSAAQSNHLIDLPFNAQRSISFIPGDWDPMVKDTTDSSNSFRNSIQTIYINEYLFKSPFFGNGFSYDANEFNEAVAKAQADADNDYLMSRVFVVGRMYHIGWISLYDKIGIVGGILVLTLWGNLVWLSGNKIFGPVENRRSPLLPLRVWILCAVVRDVVGFFTVFGTIDILLPAFAAYAAVLSHVYEIEQRPDIQTLQRQPIEGPFELKKKEMPVPIAS